MLLTRGKAFAIHLFFSLLVLAIILLVLLFVWYPGLFIEAGGWQGIRIVTGVDLILGPFITLIVYNPKKKSLKWDMTAVLVFQLVCLTAGVAIVHSQKPALLVLSDEGIHTIRYTDLDDFSIKQDDLPVTEGLHGIPLYLIDLPEDPMGNVAMKGNAELFEGKPFYALTENYRSFDWQAEQIKRYLPESAKVPDRGCYPIQVFSDHGDFNACLDENLRLLSVPSAGEEPDSQSSSLK